jgi:hypothetical protein
VPNQHPQPVLSGICQGRPERVSSARKSICDEELEEKMMRRLTWTLTFVALFALQGFAQEHYSEGPVWSVTFIRVKPAQFDAYLANLRQNAKVAYDEAKREGVIMDYKVFLKQTKASPQDWDIALALLYKNHAQMDGQAAKFEAIRDKVLGGKQAFLQAGEKRAEIREIVGIELVQEIMLK